MKRNVRKKIIVGIITMFLVLIYFTITNTSNAEDVIGTWDISAHDGKSHVTATLYSDGNMIIAGTGNMEDGKTYTAPYSYYLSNIKKLIIEEGVTNIGDFAFWECRELTSIKIVNSITKIGNSAFYNCSSLTSIEIPNSVTSIEEYAFGGCTSLTEIKIPNSVISIERGTFKECENLTNVIIPEGVTKIEEGVFGGCSNLRSISIPSSVTSINYNICSGCYSLIKIKVDENNNNYASENGVLINKNKTEIVAYPPGKPDKIYKIPEGVNKIGYCAFITSNLESIIIPKGVTRIESRAFDSCTKLMNIEIPEGINFIKDKTFFNCWNLKNVILPNTLRTIDNYAFEHCINLTSINLPESIDDIKATVFSGCKKLKNINIPEKVTNVDYLHDINLENVTISSNNNFIVENGVVFNKEKTKLIYYFREKIDKNYTIPNGTTEIDEDAFYGCDNLKNVVIPEGVTSIGYRAFSECKNLEEIIMPNSITNIEKRAFDGCSSLRSINLPNGITNICESTFSGCKSLTNINIPEGVTKIDDRSFSGCTSLTNVKIPEGVTTIGYNAFYECIKLINVDIPGSVTGLDQAFDRAIINIAFSNENNEIELPNIIRKAKIERNILYADDITCYGCKINSDFTKIEVEGNMASIKINSGKLKGLTLNIYLSGKVLYSNCNDSQFYWTNKDVNAILLLAEGEQVINNNGSEIYTFTENGEFTFIYRDINGETREVTAKVDKIDREKPTIENVHINPSEWTNDTVAVVVDAIDNNNLNEYAFKTVSSNIISIKNNMHEFEKNNPCVEITVSDDAGNVSDSVEIEITNIDNYKPIIHTIEGNVDNWTKEDVILRVNAEDTLSGIKDYSFDGGTTWQTSNEKTYTENTQNIVIKVRDNAGNISEYEPISITKIIKLENIEIRQQPEKTEYVEGENFNVAGMKVVAIYDNGAEEEITRYMIVNGNNLREGQESVTVRYKEGDITKEVIQKITVEKRLVPDVGDYEIIEDNGVKYIEKIKEGTKIKELKEKIKTNGTIEIYKGNTKVTDGNEVIGTGMTLKAKLGDKEERFKLVVTGDVTGDGKIKMADLLKLARYKAGIDKTLNGAYLRAGDVVKNGEIGMPDILKLSRVLAGIENI